MNQIPPQLDWRSQLQPQERRNFIEVLVKSIISISNSNNQQNGMMLQQKYRKLAEDFEKLSFANAKSKNEYIEFLRKKILSIRQSYQQQMNSQAGNQYQKMGQMNQNQMSQNQMSQNQMNQNQINQNQMNQNQMGQMNQNQMNQTTLNQINQPTPEQRAFLARQAQLRQQQQQNYLQQQQQKPDQNSLKAELKTARIPDALLKRIPGLPAGVNTWQQIMQLIQTQKPSMQFIEIVRQVHATHAQLLQASKAQVPRQSVPASLQSASLQSPSVNPSMSQTLSMPQSMPSSLQPQQSAAISRWTQQAVAMLNKLKASGQIPANVTPEQQQTFIKKFVSHQTARAQQKPLSQPQPSHPQQTQPSRPTPPPRLPQYTPQQLPTGHQQTSPVPRTDPLRNNMHSGSGRLFPGVVAKEEDWLKLRSVYEEVKNLPIRMANVTNQLSPESKSQFVERVKTINQLYPGLVNVSTNFYMLTKNYDATKKLVHIQNMCKEIIEHLKRNEYIGGLELLAKIHEQIQYYARYVKGLHGKLVNGLNMRSSSISQPQTQTLATTSNPHELLVTPQPAGISAMPPDLNPQLQRKRHQPSAPTRSSPMATPAPPEPLKPAEPTPAQILIKQNEEVMAKEEEKLSAIEAAKNKRKALAASDPTTYFLATLANAFNLKETEASLNETKSAKPKQPSPSGLTPSAVLQTPVSLSGDKKKGGVEDSNTRLVLRCVGQFFRQLDFVKAINVDELLLTTTMTSVTDAAKSLPTPPKEKESENTEKQDFSDLFGEDDEKAKPLKFWDFDYMKTLQG